MRTRSEEEMMSLIMGFAEADERIRAVVMNGSRANPNASRDPFQDFDVANFVTEVAPFRDEAYVLPRFGEALVVEQPLIGPWPPDDADGSYHNYNIQLVDGNRIDLSFYQLDRLADRLEDSLTVVLLDKDGLAQSVPPADESSYYLTEPTQELYDGCCTGFLFALGSHIPKTIWRGHLPYLKFLIESWVRETLVMMLGWEIGSRTGWDKSLGSKGKYLERYLTPEAWRKYAATFVDADIDRLWVSLFLFHEIFEEAARSVAERCGYRFPEEKSSKVLAFLKHVRTLPQDAERIY